MRFLGAFVGLVLLLCLAEAYERCSLSTEDGGDDTVNVCHDDLVCCEDDKTKCCSPDSTTSAPASGKAGKPKVKPMLKIPIEDVEKLFGKKTHALWHKPLVPADTGDNTGNGEGIPPPA